MKHFKSTLYSFSRQCLSLFCLLTSLFLTLDAQGKDTHGAITIDEIGYKFDDTEGKATVCDVPRNYSSTRLTIPSTVTNDGKEYQVAEIADYAFYDTDNIVEVTIPASVTTIGESAFQGCNALSIINILSVVPPCENFNVRRHEPGGYFQKSVNVLVLPEALQIYEQKWGGKNSLNKIYPLGMVSIENNTEGFTFIANKMTKEASILFVPNIEKCVIPSELATEELAYSVKSLESGCFDEKEQIKEIDIPESVTNIGSQACNGCNNLVSVTLHATTPPSGYISLRKHSESSWIITNLFIMVPTEAINAYETWSSKAYDHYSDYRTILAIGSELSTAEDGIQYITNKNTQEATVYKGINEETITIPETVTIDGSTYTVTAIASNSFEDMDKVKTFNLPSTVTKLPSSGNICENNDLAITIHATTPPTGSPNSLSGDEKEVVEETYSYGTYEVTYLATSNSIVFVPTESLEAYKEWSADFQNIRIFPIGSLACFKKVNGNKYLIDPENENTTLIRAYKEGGYEIPENIEIEGKKYTVSNIGSYSIEKFCDNIALPNSITNIESYACWYNKKVTSLTVPEGVTSIGKNAFTFDNLEELTLPSTLQTVGYTFLSSSKIKSVTCKAVTPPTFDVPNYFSESGYLESYKLKNATLYVPEGTEELYKAAKGWKLFYTVETTPTSIKATTVDSKPQVTISSNSIEVSELTNNETVSLYDAEGKLLSTAPAQNGKATLTKPATGNLFIIKTKNATFKLATK